MGAATKINLQSETILEGSPRRNLRSFPFYESENTNYHMNDCNFSHDRVYRYSLTHKWKTLFPGKAITWIGLNPSTADELELDRTLKRIKSFSTLWGYNTFHMLNLFAFRATDPEIMKKQPDPVGPDNDRCLSGFCSKSKCIVAVWGNHGNHIDRSETVLNSILKDFERARLPSSSNVVLLGGPIATARS
jgi:hypothetical protein